MSTLDRYHRQTLLPQLQRAGQERLLASRVLLIGCGALGCNIAQQLVRSGVGHIRIVDRDLVDLTNLHRQVLFTDADARELTPKALAAARVLRAANPDVVIDPIVADVHSDNIAEIATRGGFAPDVILDGTDNAQIRYLINDLACRDAIPWIYGACIGVEGRVMLIVPHQSACLRCLFPEPPAPGELDTCDTAGVLGAAAAVVGSLQAAQALRLLVEGSSGAGNMLALNVWTMSFRAISAGARREDCACCGRGDYQFLHRPAALDAAALCGRDAVQVRPITTGAIDLLQLGAKLRALGEVAAHPSFARFRPTGSALTLSIFPDGRVIVNGTSDIAVARALVARYIGA